MASTLFKQFGRAIKREAIREFEATALGELFDDAYEVLESFHRGRHRGFHPIRDLAARSPLTHFMRRAKALSRKGVVAELLSMSGDTGREIGEAVEQYERGKDKTVSEVFDEEIRKSLAEAGPIGQVLLAMVGGKRRTRGGNARVKRELDTMTKALNAFGFETLHKPTDTNPPTQREIDAAKAVLQAAGYTVIPPSKRGQQPTVLVGRNRSRHPAGVTQQRGASTVAAYGAKRVKVSAGGSTVVVPKDDPLVTGEMITVDSSNVHSIGYDLGGYPNGDLLVRFLGHAKDGSRSGPGPLYVYYSVPISVFQRFRHAASKGTFVWQELRIPGTVSGHRFDYRLAETEGNYVPRKATLERAGEVYEPRIGILTPGMKSLPREVVRLMSREQYRRATRNSLESNRGRGRDVRSRSR